MCGTDNEHDASSRRDHDGDGLIDSGELRALLLHVLGGCTYRLAQAGAATYCQLSGGSQVAPASGGLSWDCTQPTGVWGFLMCGLSWGAWGGGREECRPKRACVLWPAWFVCGLIWVCRPKQT